jgi:hypothetical protein
MLSHGMWATDYTLRRQDEENFGGLREMVLERDGYCCRVCDAPGIGKRRIIVQIESPALITKLMISLCPACHARIHRSKTFLVAMPPLLLVLWREQYLKRHKQKRMDFNEITSTTATVVPLS